MFSRKSVKFEKIEINSKQSSQPVKQISNLTLLTSTIIAMNSVYAKKYNFYVFIATEVNSVNKKANDQQLQDQDLQGYTSLSSYPKEIKQKLAKSLLQAVPVKIKLMSILFKKSLEDVEKTPFLRIDDDLLKITLKEEIRVLGSDYINRLNIKGYIQNIIAVIISKRAELLAKYDQNTTTVNDLDENILQLIKPYIISVYDAILSEDLPEFVKINCDYIKKGVISDKLFMCYNGYLILTMLNPLLGEIGEEVIKANLNEKDSLINIVASIILNYLQKPLQKIGAFYKSQSDKNNNDGMNDRDTALPFANELLEKYKIEASQFYINISKDSELHAERRLQNNQSDLEVKKIEQFILSNFLTADNKSDMQWKIDEYCNDLLLEISSAEKYSGVKKLQELNESGLLGCILNQSDVAVALVKMAALSQQEDLFLDLTKYFSLEAKIECARHADLNQLIERAINNKIYDQQLPFVFLLLVQQLSAQMISRMYAALPEIVNDKRNSIKFCTDIPSFMQMVSLKVEPILQLQNKNLFRQDELSNEDVLVTSLYRYLLYAYALKKINPAILLNEAVIKDFSRTILAIFIDMKNIVDISDPTGQRVSAITQMLENLIPLIIKNIPNLFESKINTERKTSIGDGTSLSAQFWHGGISTQVRKRSGGNVSIPKPASIPLLSVTSNPVVSNPEIVQGTDSINQTRTRQRSKSFIIPLNLTQLVNNDDSNSVSFEKNEENKPKLQPN